jgi:diaminopimelate epimerase
MKIKFTKMHGCGNDYIYINDIEDKINSPEALSIKLSDRRRGIGGDGIILICKSDKADAKMRIFNADGSEGKMCGNGIRCVGKFLYDNKLVLHKDMKIDTLSGIKNVNMCESAGHEGENVSILSVDMGKPEFSPEKIPVKLKGDKVINKEVEIEGEKYKINCVSMGNPHCVIFCEDVFGADVEGIGKKLEKRELFPEGVNVEFIHIDDEKSISMRVWERGSRETFACGTGACAAVVSAVENGFFHKNQDIEVRLRGGNLIVKYEEDRVYMTGPAEEVFKGEVDI